MKKTGSININRDDIEKCLVWSLKREAKLKHDADINCHVEWKGTTPERAEVSFVIEKGDIPVKDNWQWLNEKDIDAGKWVQKLNDTVKILKLSQTKAELPLLYDAAIQELLELRDLMRIEIRPIKEKEENK
jgi:hypothetical protein